MLLLHFASRGYRVRYTTDSTNLSVLKQSLSSDPTIKEVILLDDCLGQAYFQMKESQSTELLALIKYVHLSDNKYLILNSRVTIYKEAKERKPELITSLDRKEYKTYLLNMSEISLFEKAKMLYNHLYFSEISHEYYLAIKSGRKYRKIIEHKNYNPRIIEFISCPTLISNVPPEMYFKFIMGKLDDPQDIWKDEYERKLLTVDRIFLLTLYSLTDTSTKMSELKTCFDFWVQREKSIDSTIDQFESALKRLQGSFIKVIDMMGIKHISVVNPSVNDYLSALIHNNPSIQKTILNNACSLNQFAKMLTSDEFAEFSEKMIVSEGALTLVYETDFQRNAFFATYIPKYHIQNEKYTNYLHSFLWSPTFLMITHQVFLNKFSILEQLLTTENIIFYNLKNVLSSNNLRKILENEVFGNLIDYVRLLSPIFTDSKRDTYLQISSSIIKEAIESLCEDVNAGDCDYDVGKAMHSLMLQHISIDEDESILLDGIEEYIEADIEANTIIDIQNRICCLPEDIQERIKFDDQRSINVHGARRIAESYLAEINFDEDLIERGEQWDEIDSLFHRN